MESHKDYRLETIRDNLRLFTPEIMARISAEVIRAGYELIDMNTHAPIKGRCDSFVLKAPLTYIPVGKAGVPVELGLRVAAVALSYTIRCMQNTTGDKIAVDIVKETQVLFPSFKACSFDKGFHSLGNQQDLKDLLDQVTLPKKGKLSVVDKAREYDDDFKQAKKQHSAVESAINTLEVHGLDKCPDHGIEGFKRYVDLAVLSRNIQILGSIKRSIERQRLQEQKQAA